MLTARLNFGVEPAGLAAFLFAAICCNNVGNLFRITFDNVFATENNEKKANVPFVPLGGRSIMGECVHCLLEF